MDFFKTLLTRRSTRAYLNKPVAEEKLIKIMGAGLHSASAMNRQPYQVFVVQNKTLRGKIVRAQSRINFWMKEAPVIIVVAVKKAGQADWGTLADRYLDAGIMIENMMLAATALGLGSCACAAFGRQKVQDILKLSEKLIPILCLPIGYPRERNKGNLDLVKGYEKIVHLLTHYKARTIDHIFVRK